ncbi:MAG: ribose 5-phosphate isomerase B [Phycisphaerales bacterium]|nr:MAG: ribose 5-phosphate isomerase B [Phycisphaerales bacterium]
MRIAVSSDHRGFTAKQHVVELLQRANHEVDDFGCPSSQVCDYPDVGLAAADAVAEGRCDRGILLCGTGIGMSIAANKVRGVRAAAVHDELTAMLSRKHNDANILCLAADLMGEELIRRVIEVFLNTEFEGGRHQRRIQKITDYEKRNDRVNQPG